jgi:DNA-binding response OmpR family regulator
MEHTDVLLVEDDDNIRNLYVDALSAADLRVHAVATAGEGVTFAHQHHPQLILMDITLPDGNGHDAVAQIRADQWGKNAKIIYLTNHINPANVFAAVEHGSEDYIIKAHTEIKDLVNRVRLALHT